jgi:hypothetical protein
VQHYECKDASFEDNGQQDSGIRNPDLLLKGTMPDSLSIEQAGEVIEERVNNQGPELDQSENQTP